MAETIRPATGSHSFFQTGSVLVIHSARVQASIVPIPEGSAEESSSHRSARRSASATSLRSALVTGGLPTGRTVSSVGSAGGAASPISGIAKPIGIMPAPDWFVVSEESAICRAKSQLTGLSPEVLANICCI